MIPQIFVPDLTKEVGPATQLAVRQLFQVVQQHEQAFSALKTQVDAKTTAVTSTTATAVAAVSATAMTKPGTVNNQTGTTYTIQDGDYQGLVTFSNASPVAVTLNPSVRQYWYAALENLGASSVTVTPGANMGSTGTLNGAGSIILTSNMGCWIFFDGTNWWAMTVPVQPANTPAIAHQFFTAYNSTTGIFSEAQPAFTDVSGVATAAQLPALSAISGQITSSQLPSSGLTVTITSAKLTSGGTNGSQTFTNGLLTGQVAAT